MIFNKDTASKTAELLLQINAIKLNSENPFTWASGWKSPIYCDNRVILSFPAIRNYIRDEFSKNIEKQFGKPDVIAGVATGAIGIGILVAESLGLPFVYVRPEAKKHGRLNQVEGFLQKGQNVIVVEDLISTGNSSLLAVEALRNEGANVKGMAAVFSYGFQVATDNFANAKVDLFTLSNYESLLELAVAKEYITKKEQNLLQEWRKNPSEWNVVI
ncbi:orotate phosphoribosyltransferase [Flavobacterium psychrophilum]|uniref:Orotate phosphoribosyltransferase n=2 Tax=Flavobacterium psychrophilum TaxID=96345 RepID=A6GXE4_FLAPJ|nr:orotate phosphoribosyltransferase [Flavobacterium psychrophilum]AIG29562.1 orotate phosphoribosyltransferase [Flavobacterium psychrophilum]AIG31839.1 orotate phosphoribosyltransferase [Flavobacterium psychrophilum]AIG33993.1 orotate phosphoribosyltransferase [Flavobacterium psychrophilum]AIG36356.1 orotate phosphoribosyltransferase [Flavobacterium psychrophilum]AIG38622.1 orotate phosphoribosyltransferase [Flavobacterium psychrophilum]